MPVQRVKRFGRVVGTLVEAIEKRCVASVPAERRGVSDVFECAVGATLDGIDGGRRCRECQSGCDVLAAPSHDDSDILSALTWIERTLVCELSGRESDALVRALERLHRCRTMVLAKLARLRAEADLDASDRESPSLRLLVGRSAAMDVVRQLIERAAGSDASVLLVGESGTGKELAARAIHEASGARGPLVVVNCATLPEGLMESELFGHRKGAYTGADSPHRGLVKAAEGGTLFLDEITEMNASCQAKLLRLLEEGTFRPVGSTEEVRVPVRFIASTNRDPMEAVRLGFLREDIYYRLNVHRIDMPPLRSRMDDLEELVAHFLRLSTGDGAPLGLSAEAQQVLLRHEWPGNVRELRNAMAYGLCHARGPAIEICDLPPELRRHPQDRASHRLRVARVREPIDSIPTFAEAEKRLVMRALSAFSGNKVRAAKTLGISRHRLYEKIRKYDLQG